MISVFIQTLNEEINLPRCLESVSWSDDIVVLDSYSTDNTEKIARSHGCRFYQREYEGRAANQNWAVANIKFKYDWVWYVDADEVTPAVLYEELLSIALDTKNPNVLYRVRFKNILFDKWSKRSSLYPTWISRFFKPNHIRWERAANPVAIIDGPEGKLQGQIIHYSFNKGFSHWIQKHDKYSSYEALETIKSLGEEKLIVRNFLSPEASIRRYELKKLSFRLPARPVLKFIYMYFIRLGFLDGRVGLIMCSLASIYEYFIVLKVKEIRRRNNDLPI